MARSLLRPKWAVALCLMAILPRPGRATPPGAEIFSLGDSGPPRITFKGPWVLVDRLETDLDASVLRQLSDDPGFRQLAEKEPSVHLIEEIWAQGEGDFRVTVRATDPPLATEVMGTARLTTKVIRVQTMVGGVAWADRQARREVQVLERRLVYDNTHPGVRVSLEADGLCVTLPSEAMHWPPEMSRGRLFVLARRVAADVGVAKGPKRGALARNVVRRVVRPGSSEFILEDISDGKIAGADPARVGARDPAQPVRLTFRAWYGGDWDGPRRGSSWSQAAGDLVILEPGPPPTPLMQAAQDGQLERVSAHLRRGAKVDARGADGSTALHLAAHRGHSDVAKALIGKGAAVNARQRDGTTALMLAAEEGHAPLVHDLLDKGAEVDARAGNGATALLMAARSGRAAAVQALLGRGADPSATTAGGHTALSLARAQGWTEVVRLLTGEQRPGDVAPQPGKAPEVSDPAVDRLAEAAESGQVEEVLACLGKSIDVNARASHGSTALILAASGGHLEVARVLLDRGADANGTEADGRTALMAAAMEGYVELVRALLARGAQANARTQGGDTALSLARVLGRAEVAAALEEAGAEP